MSSLLEYYRKNTDENGNIVFSRVKEEDIKINGYSIEEVITILNGLSIERITDIQVTMKNLSKLGEKIQQDFQNSLDKSMARIIYKDFTGITTSGGIKMNREEKVEEVSNE